MNNTKKNFLLFFVSIFLFDLFKSLFYGIGSLFYTEGLGLTTSSVFFIKAFNPLSIILFEIISGYIGDKISRKLNFLISCFLCSISFLLYYNAYLLWHCIVAEVVYSSGIAFYTGSLEAIVITEAKDREKFLSNAFAIRTVGLLLGGLIGIFISWYSWYLPWLVGSLGFPLAAAFSLGIEKRVYFEKKKTKNIVSPIPSFLIILAFCLSLVNGPFFNYWPNFLKSIGVKSRSIGYIFVYLMYNLSMFLGTRISKKFKIFKEEDMNLYLSGYLILGASFFMMISPEALAVPFFMIFELSTGIYSPKFYSSYNNWVENENRTFMLSLLSAFQKGVSVISLFFVSFLTKKFFDGKASIALISAAALAMLTISFSRRKIYGK